MSYFSAVVVFPELIGAEGAQVGQMLPYLILQLRSPVPTDVPIDFEEVDRPTAIPA